MFKKQNILTPKDVFTDDFRKNINEATKKSEANIGKPLPDLMHTLDKISKGEWFYARVFPINYIVRSLQNTKTVW